MGINFLEFIDSLSLTLRATPNTPGLIGNANSTEEGFFNHLSVQMEHLSRQSVTRENHPEGFGYPPGFPVAKGGKFSPPPEIFDRPPDPEESPAFLYPHLMPPLATVEPTSDTQDSDLVTQGFMLNTLKAPNSNHAKPKEQTVTPNFGGIASEIDKPVDHIEDPVIKIAHFNPEFRTGDSSPLIPDKMFAELQRPVGQTGWDEELGERIVWLIDKSRLSTGLKLNPPQLGPIEVKIDMTGDQAKIAFSSQHAHVREALEAAIPRLREMLGAQQIQLIDAVVSQQSFGDYNHSKGHGQFSERNTPHANGSAVGGQTEIDQDSSEEEKTFISQGILSLYV